MGGHLGFYDLDSRLRELSAKGDDLERISALVGFDVFRLDLVGVVPRFRCAGSANRRPRSSQRQHGRCWRCPVGSPLVRWR